MELLNVSHLKKIYTPRFGGTQVQALSDVNFSVEEGEFVAIMGESGSGKTTLLNILATLDKPTAGEVLLSGVDMGSIPEKQLAMYRRNNLGFVFQDFNLLDTFSMKDNIMLPLVLSGKTYSEMAPKMMELSRRLSIEKILEKYPYEVSGGQKQRLSIARAIAKQPEIYIFDDSFSALDFKTDAALRKALKEETEEATTLIVAQRISTILHADRILVLDEGKVVGMGTHKELLQSCEVYQQIARSQLSQEELDYE